MKIGVILPGFSAHAGDWCTPSLLDHVRRLAVQANVHVFTLRWPERRGRYDVCGATVHALGGRKRMGGRVLALWARALSAIAAEHARGAFTVLHATCADEAALVAVWAKLWLGIPVVISVTGGELRALPDINYGLQLLTGRRRLARYTLGRADRVTAGSAYLEAQVADFGGPAIRRRLVRAPFGVDLGRFTRLAGERAAGPSLSVGSLTPVKDHALTLASVARTRSDLTVAGDGPLRQELAGAAEGLGIGGRVRWLGPVAHDRMPAVYGQCTLLVHTSRHEAQGMAILEAAASGLPVVGTSVGVLPELVPNAWSLPPPGDARLAVTVLSEQIDMLQSDARLRQRLGEHARAVVDERFGLERTCERFLRIYETAGREGAYDCEASAITSS